MMVQLKSKQKKCYLILLPLAFSIIYPFTSVAGKTFTATCEIPAVYNSVTGKVTAPTSFTCGEGGSKPVSGNASFSVTAWEPYSLEIYCMNNTGIENTQYLLQDWSWSPNGSWCGTCARSNKDGGQYCVYMCSNSAASTRTVTIKSIQCQLQ